MIDYSVIIRTKNEDKWIEKCLISLCSQILKPAEIIIVDNDSTDNTLKIIKKFNCKIIKYNEKKFNYSKAINIGIKKTRSEIVSILSAHCIPFDTYWAYHALKGFSDKEIFAVYSRQIPTESTRNADHRDLFQVFRKQDSIQNNDIYFNNASSFIRRDYWKKLNFNENINGLEDIIWVKNFLKKGKKIFYSSESRVFHFHGINQNNNSKRLDRHIKILKKI
tara:strand:- start:168 stop:830 length:663 start_codon:yes stop_codon:yes gene_type:complete